MKILCKKWVGNDFDVCDDAIDDGVDVCKKCNFSDFVRVKKEAVFGDSRAQEKRVIEVIWWCKGIDDVC